MDKETLSNYGWIVICVLVLAVMIALATPFGNYIKDAVWSTTQGLFDTGENALNTIGISSTGQQPIKPLVNVRDNYELQNGYMTGDGELKGESTEANKYIRIPVQEGEEWFIWFPNSAHLSKGTGALRFEDASNQLVSALNMGEQPQYYINTNSTVHGVSVEVPLGVSYMCLKLKFGSSFDYTESAIVANCTNTPKVAFLGDSIIDTGYTDAEGEKVNYSLGHLATTELNALYSDCGVSGTGYVDYHRFSVDKIPTNADYIVIYGSFNDLYSKDSNGNFLAIGNADDVYIDGNENSEAANMNYVYDYIESNYPSAKIAVISPSPWRESDPYGIGRLSTRAQEYVNVLEQICTNRGYKFYDLFRTSGLEPWTDEHNNLYYIADGCHPNTEGHKILASKIKPFLQNVINNK